MVQRLTPAQLQRMRQSEQKRRQAISKYNAAVRKRNSDTKRAIDTYNRGARAHNARVRANHHRLQREVARFHEQRSATRFIITQTSTIALHYAFQRVEEAADAAAGWDARREGLVDLAEAETAASARMANALLGQPAVDDLESITDTALTDELSSVSSDLDQRWRGALFALNTRNPDAARHFCTSAREIVIKMIDIKAPDEVVLNTVPDCETTKDGKPLRRQKIEYLVQRSNADYENFGDFVDANVDDVLELFGVFNRGTHGASGALDMPALQELRRRVEGAVRFLSAVVRGI